MDASAPLDISPTDQGVSLRGEIDAHTAPALAEALAALTGDRLVVDLSGIDFVDSSGLRVLIQAHQQAADAGRTLVLARPSASVRRLLEISGLNDYLIVDDG